MSGCRKRLMITWSQYHISIVSLSVHSYLLLRTIRYLRIQDSSVTLTLEGSPTESSQVFFILSLLTWYLSTECTETNTVHSTSDTVRAVKIEYFYLLLYLGWNHVAGHGRQRYRVERILVASVSSVRAGGVVAVWCYSCARVGRVSSGCLLIHI